MYINKYIFYAHLICLLDSECNQEFIGFTNVYSFTNIFLKTFGLEKIFFSYPGYKLPKYVYVLQYLFLAHHFMVERNTQENKNIKNIVNYLKISQNFLFFEKNKFK